jgi:hypothetical protein
VITDPIDMLTIEANIKNDKYTSEEEIIADFKVRNLLLNSEICKHPACLYVSQVVER